MNYGLRSRCPLFPRAPAPALALARSLSSLLPSLCFSRLHLVWILVVAKAQMIRDVAKRKPDWALLPLPHMRELVPDEPRVERHIRIDDDRATECHRGRGPAHAGKQSAEKRNDPP